MSQETKKSGRSHAGVGKEPEEEYVNPKTGKPWLTCTLTSLPCREEDKYAVIDDPDCDKDWAKLPYEYIQTNRNPWKKGAFVFRRLEFLMRWAAFHPQLLPAAGYHLVLQMIITHHGILRLLQPSPPFQVMARFQSNGRGLSDAQMMYTQLFPSAIFTYQRCPRKPPVFPKEEHVFRDKNADFLRYYSTTGIPDEIVRKLWTDKSGAPIKTVPWDGDPDSDAEVDFMPLDYGQDKSTVESKRAAGKKEGGHKEKEKEATGEKGQRQSVRRGRTRGGSGRGGRGRGGRRGRGRGGK